MYDSIKKKKETLTVIDQNGIQISSPELFGAEQSAKKLTSTTKVC